MRVGIICQRLDMEVHYVAQKGQSETHISSWFGLWMHWAVLAVSNIPSKWVCCPHWEAKSIKQLLWHLENPFTMIETIQLKPLQSVLSFSRTGTSHIWFFQIHWKEKQSPYQYKKMTSILVLNPWNTWNTGCIAPARFIWLTVFSVLVSITSCAKTSLYYW